jgi:glycosyltransferase involved in cell wall biosynthesis
MMRRLSDVSSWQEAGILARTDLDAPLRPIPAEDGRAVLLVVSRRGSMLGQVWMRADGHGVISPEQQWRAIVGELYGEMVRSEVRHQIRRRLGWSTPLEQGHRISVIVCTRERPDALVRCLDSLEALRPAAHEVIVVDNAPSSERTRELCAQRDVRYVLEPTPGQSRARNRGIEVATGDLLAFTDDDCVADPDWLAGLAGEFTDPLLMAVTGFIGPASISAPAQLHFEAHGGFERHAERRRFEAVTASPVMAAAIAGAGANMVFRRSVFSEIGPFAEHLGPGTPARSSDDKEMFYRILAAGYRIVYDPARVIWHHHRDTAGMLNGILHDYGISEFAWTLDVLDRRRELATLRLWRWWGGQFAREFKALVRPRPDAVPLPRSLLWHQLAGVARAPQALAASRASRRSIEPVRVAPASAPPPPAVDVVSEPPSGVTLTIASHNRSESLRQTLRAVAAQTLPAERLEVVVVLDGSSDSSTEMLRAIDMPFALRTVWQAQQGLAVARNRGAREAAHPLVIFSDDDIRPAPQFAAAHAARHAALTRPSVVLGPYPPANRDASFAALTVRNWWLDHFRRLEDPAHRWTFTDVCDGNLSVTAELWNRLGGLDEMFSGGRRQDFELGIRLLKDGTDLVFEPRARGDHHFDSSTATLLRNAEQEGQWDIVLCRKHPDVWSRLPLSAFDALGWRSPAGPASRSLARRRVAASTTITAALAGFEQLRMRQTWTRLYSRLWWAHYATGVRKSLPSTAERRAFFADRRPAPAVEVALDEPGVAALNVATAAPELRLTLRGFPVACVPAILPGGQWDLEDLIERGVHAVSETAAVAAVHDMDQP